MSSSNSSNDCFWHLPMEMRANILSYLTYDSLLNAIHASLALHASFMPDELEGQICRSLLRRNIDENFLPLAITLYIAECESRKNGFPKSDTSPKYLYTEKVVTFCEKHLKDPRVNSLDPTEVRGEMTVRMLKFYQIAQDIAGLIAVQVGKGLPQLRRPNEWSRMVKCAYIYELATIIVGPKVPRRDEENLKAWRSFWRCFAPWEVAGIPILETCIGSEMHYKGIGSIDRHPRERTSPLSLRQFHYVPFGSSSPFRRHIEYDTFSLSNALHLDKLLWYPSGILDGQLGMKAILDVTQRYQGEEHAGPRDLFLWAHLFNGLRHNSPLSGMTVGWGTIFNVSGSIMFGHPHMGRYCFQDRYTLERVYAGRYPTMEAMVAEAEAIIGQ
ncbi:hypothetical protein K449DRAFT_444053 [Hypoxylon sp. EC38]|nr:hypothetical protein K449DRAFT_444053 [Hypoxylon sp. EC38]